MKPRVKKAIRLPEVSQKNTSYTLHSINIANKGCYNDNKKLLIDEGYGDYNMKIFRVKERRKYAKSIPTAFTPSIHNLLEYKTNNPREKRLATEHNDEIQRILNEPKEVYLELIRQQRQIQQSKRRQEQRKYEYVMGQDKQVREYNEQLSFNYLSQHQSDQWFKVIDKSKNYMPPIPLILNASAISFTSNQTKQRKKKGHIFMSDDKSIPSFFK